MSVDLIFLPSLPIRSAPTDTKATYTPISVSAQSKKSPPSTTDMPLGLPAFRDPTLMAMYLNQSESRVHMKEIPTDPRKMGIQDKLAGDTSANETASMSSTTTFRSTVSLLKSKIRPRKQ